MLIDEKHWSRFVVGSLEASQQVAVRQAATHDDDVAARLRLMGAVVGREVSVEPVEEVDEADDPDSVSDLSRFRAALQGMREGDEAAAWELVERFAPHIQRVVRRRLDTRLRSKYDSQDFVQMVWASLFRAPERILDFSHPKDFTRFVAAMARNKVIDETRRRHTAKYDVKVEESFSDDSYAEVSPDTPSQVAMARECWNRMLDSEPEQNRRLVQLRLQGFTYREIAEKVGLNEKTVRLIVARLIERGAAPRRGRQPD